MHNMNPQRARHMSGGSSEEHGGEAKPHIFVHSHKNGHTVHLFHNDGSHEEHEHGHDAASVADRVHESLGGEQRPEHDNEAGAESGSGQAV